MKKSVKEWGKCAGLAQLAWMLFLPQPAAGDSIVVPNSYANTEGAYNNDLPFNIAAQSLTSARYQQIYGASQFASIPGGGYITQILFRPDTGIHGYAFSSALGDVQIVLSTTSATVGGLNATFSTNIGPGAVSVYFGALPLSSACTGPTNGPKNFDVVINLRTPFFYNPAHGNLLMDVWNYDGGSTTYFDTVNGGGVSRAYSLTGVSATYGWTDGLGLVTEFTVIPPVLSFTSTATNLMLSWPTNAAAWQLQGAPNPTGQWSNYATSTQIQGGNTIATVPTTNSSLFFRLCYKP
jgi:hypothetical protein